MLPEVPSIEPCIGNIPDGVELDEVPTLRIERTPVDREAIPAPSPPVVGRLRSLQPLFAKPVPAMREPNAFHLAIAGANGVGKLPAIIEPELPALAKLADDPFAAASNMPARGCATGQREEQRQPGEQSHRPVRTRSTTTG